MFLCSDHTLQKKKVQKKFQICGSTPRQVQPKGFDILGHFGLQAPTACILNTGKYFPQAICILTLYIYRPLSVVALRMQVPVIAHL